MKLIIGNQNYSSWSMRPWLLLTAFGIEFDQQVISLRDEGMRGRLLEVSAAAKVPILVDNGLKIWDTLAICEYISEVYLDGKGWPQDVKQRAIARAFTAEMHAGFAALRGEMPMNVRARHKITLSEAAKMEISHIDAIWSECADDAFLFGDYGIVDCFFSPVASRFQTYGIEISAKAQAYADRLLSHAAMQKWTEMARLETEFLRVDEVGEKLDYENTNPFS